MNYPFAIFAMLLVAGCLTCFDPEELARQQPPPQQQQQSQQQPPSPAPSTNTVFYQDVSWSPDGSRLTFSALRDGRWDIYLMRHDGSQTFRLTNDAELSSFYITWSAGGEKIAFGARRGKTNATSQLE